LIFLVSLAALYGIWATWEEIQLLERIRDGLFVTLEAAAASDARVSTAGLLYLTSFVAALVVYLMWIYRAVSNLDAVRTGVPIGPLRFSPGWAVGWYFVPIMNLFRPFQVMRELYRESNPDHRSSWLIGAWWTLWIIATMLGPGVTGLFIDPTIETAIASDWRIIASEVVLVVDAVLIYLVIDRITSWQEDRGRSSGPA
jgi:Domain of unknown function (DUF4328)